MGIADTFSQFLRIGVGTGVEGSFGLRVGVAGAGEDVGISVGATGPEQEARKMRMKTKIRLVRRGSSISTCA